MGNKLPKGWRNVRLGDVAHFIGGGTPSKQVESYFNGAILWATVRDMNVDIIEDTEIKISETGLKNSSSKIVPKGNIIIATRVGVGKVCRNKFDTAINQDLRGICPNDQTDVQYLFYYLKSLTDYLQSISTGATVKGIRSEQVIGLPVPLPPLPEQHRIVAKLDRLFERIDRAIALVEENITNANHLLGSVLNDVFEHAEEKGWIATNIGDCFELKTGGTPSTNNRQYYENGTIKWLVSGDINQGEIFDCEGRITEYAVKNSNARLLPKDSVLIALNGQGKTRGTVAMLRTEATCNQSLVAMITKDDSMYLPDFLYYQLKWQYIPIRMLTGMVDRRGLNMPIIRNIKVVFPDLPTQRRIVGAIKEIEEKRSELLNRLLPKHLGLKALKSSLLDAAFKGEL